MSLCKYIFHIQPTNPNDQIILSVFYLVFYFSFLSLFFGSDPVCLPLTSASLQQSHTQIFSSLKAKRVGLTLADYSTLSVDVSGILNGPNVVSYSHIFLLLYFVRLALAPIYISQYHCQIV